LKKWEKNCIGNIKIQLAIVKEVIWLLDQAQERRVLSQQEVNFRTRLKEMYLGFVTVEKIKACQRARMTNIKYGDANTSFSSLEPMEERGKSTYKSCTHRKGWQLAMKTKQRKLRSTLAKC
jgi:hypothetical protein